MQRAHDGDPWHGSPVKAILDGVTAEQAARRPANAAHSIWALVLLTDAASAYDSIHHMKRTTIFVPEPLERDLQLYARHERKPVASVVREALVEYLAARRPAAALPSFVGIGQSGRSDIAERHEELLWTAPGHAPASAAPRAAAGRKARTRSSKRRG